MRMRMRRVGWWVVGGKWFEEKTVSHLVLAIIWRDSLGAPEGRALRVPAAVSALRGARTWLSRLRLRLLVRIGNHSRLLMRLRGETSDSKLGECREISFQAFNWSVSGGFLSLDTNQLLFKWRINCPWCLVHFVVSDHERTFDEKRGNISQNLSAQAATNNVDFLCDFTGCHFKVIKHMIDLIIKGSVWMGNLCLSNLREFPV